VHGVEVDGKGIALAWRQSSLANPIVEATVRGTSTFICFWMKAIAALHCAAVAVHDPLMVLPSELTALLMMRLMPGSSAHHLKIREEEELVFLMGRRASRPPGAPLGGLTPRECSVRRVQRAVSEVLVAVPWNSLDRSW